MTRRGPALSIWRPISGLNTADTTKPNEKAPAVTPRSQPNSVRIGGNNSGKGGGTLTPMALRAKTTGTVSQPEKKGGGMGARPARGGGDGGRRGAEAPCGGQAGGGEAAWRPTRHCKTEVPH